MSTFNWKIDKLINHVERITKGSTPTSYGFSYQNEGISFIKIENIHNNFIDHRSLKHYISEQANINQKRSMLSEGDILFSIAGTLGKTCLIRKIDLPANTNQAFAIIKGSNKSFNPKFLLFQLQSKFIKDQVEKKARGGGMNNISLEDVENFQVFIPPLITQQKIVNEIENTLENLSAVKNKLDAVKILENNLIHCYIFESPNEKLDLIKLSDVTIECNERIGENYSDKRRVGVSAEFGITDLRTGNKSDFSNYKIVKNGYFVYNPMRVNIGSIALYEQEEVAITSPDYVVFKVRNGLSSRLLLKFLKTKYGLREIANNTHGAVRERLYFRNLSNINFPMLRNKQGEAECVLKTFDDVLNRVEKAEEEVSKLTQAILAKTFKQE